MLTKEQISQAQALKLSKNFTLYELIKSDGHPELVEYPSEAVIAQLRNLAVTILQPIRDRFGMLRINSSYRNPVLNVAVGGEKNSVHQSIYKTVVLGAAADIVPLEADIIEVFEWAFDNVPAIKTAIIYRRPGVANNPFFHVDNRSNRSGRAQLEKYGPSDYRNYK